MPEHISNLAALLRLPLTNQMIADLALQEDQSRRMAIRSGNRYLARQHRKERDRLLALIKG